MSTSYDRLSGGEKPSISRPPRWRQVLATAAGIVLLVQVLAACGGNSSVDRPLTGWQFDNRYGAPTASSRTLYLQGTYLGCDGGVPDSTVLLKPVVKSSARSVDIRFPGKVLTGAQSCVGYLARNPPPPTVIRVWLFWRERVRRLLG